MTLNSIFFVFVGGGLGSSIRYFSLCFFLYFFPSFSFISTLFVNALGCFLIGLFSVLLINHKTSSSYFFNYEFLVVGFLGGLTTFSSFINEAFSLFEKKLYTHAVFYFFMNLFFSFILLILSKKLR